MKRKMIISLSIAAAGLFAVPLLAHAAGFGPGGCEPGRLSGADAKMRLAQGGMGQGMMGQGGMGQGGMGQGMMGQGMMGMKERREMMQRNHNAHKGPHKGNVVRHMAVMRGALPEKYARMTNPLPASAENIAAGKKLYAENCASCHGESGKGDGEAGKDLNPKPANIAHILGKPLDFDGFYMWTISEGGEKLGTAMPAFKDTLSEKQRWQIIHYLRNGLGK